MKKLLYMFLFVLFLMSISACRDSEKSTESPTTDFDNLSDTEIQEQELAVQTCYSDKTFESLEEYEKEFPEFQEKWGHRYEHLTDFVTYDKIKEYGNFDFLAIATVNGQKYYYYVLVDDNGFEFLLTITPPEEYQDLSKLPVITNVENNKDLRCSTEGLGVFSVENLKYFYKEGKLSKIYWTSQSKAFQLAGKFDVLLESYSGEKPSLINSLLNAETAPAAIAEFNRKVSD